MGPYILLWFGGFFAGLSVGWVLALGTNVPELLAGM